MQENFLNLSCIIRNTKAGADKVRIRHISRYSVIYENNELYIHVWLIPVKMLSSQVLSKNIYFVQETLNSIILILWKIKNLHTFLQHKRGVYRIFISKVFIFSKNVRFYSLRLCIKRKQLQVFFSIEERNYLMFSENQIKWINLVMSVTILA